MKYLIDNIGCDDTTRFELELNDDELEIIKKFCIKNNKKSDYGCQPKIAIYTKYKKDEDGYIFPDYSTNLLKYEESE